MRQNRVDSDPQTLHVWKMCLLILTLENHPNVGDWAMHGWSGYQMGDPGFCLKESRKTMSAAQRSHQDSTESTCKMQEPDSKLTNSFVVPTKEQSGLANQQGLRSSSGQGIGNSSFPMDPHTF